MMHHAQSHAIIVLVKCMSSRIGYHDSQNMKQHMMRVCEDKLCSFLCSLLFCDSVMWCEALVMYKSVFPMTKQQVAHECVCVAHCLWKDAMGLWPLSLQSPFIVLERCELHCVVAHFKMWLHGPKACDAPPVTIAQDKIHHTIQSVNEDGTERLWTSTCTMASSHLLKLDCKLLIGMMPWGVGHSQKCALQAIAKSLQSKQTNSTCLSDLCKQS